MQRGEERADIRKNLNLFFQKRRKVLTAMQCLGKILSHRMIAYRITSLPEIVT